jgi:hypothetical protein
MDAGPARRVPIDDLNLVIGIVIGQVDEASAVELDGRR